jgi:hypothetical protein
MQSMAETISRFPFPPPEMPPNGPHYSLIGSETTNLLSARTASASHRGFCDTGAIACIVGMSSVCRIRHSCVILSLHSSSHKTSGCDDGDETGQEATIEAVQHELRMGDSVHKSFRVF